ncbi:hypothetical protein [Paenibacillus sp. 23TSA30-6]|uniref:hypothetical protein n=1 Tax=Paenibacillus sp. 23TSA30-6 TaxID=2546104 RepID=UPI001EE21B40|nr:hypothetical protein [Paenibacillus sp. 23TSA30-6]
MKKYIVTTIAAVAIVGVVGYLVKSDALQPTTNNAPIVADSKQATPNKPEPEKSGKTKVITSLSLSKSYDTLDALTNAVDLVAQVKITGIQGTLPEEDSTRYNAELTDVIKGTESEKNIVITQLGIKKDDIVEKTDNPYLKQGDELVLFLKKGQDPKINPIYFVAGEYQGKFDIKNGNVYAVNQALKEQASLNSIDAENNQYIDGQKLSTFKENIKSIVSRQE